MRYLSPIASRFPSDICGLNSVDVRPTRSDIGIDSVAYPLIERQHDLSRRTRSAASSLSDLALAVARKAPAGFGAEVQAWLAARVLGRSPALKAKN